MVKIRPVALLLCCEMNLLILMKESYVILKKPNV